MRIRIVALMLLTLFLCRSTLGNEIHEPVKTGEVAKISAPSRPLYGIASLSEEEKRILYKPFEGMFVRGEGAFGTMIPDARKTMPRAYRVGMICLKHRLNWSEVQELIMGKVPASRSRPTECAWFTLPVAVPGVELLFDFDPKGDLKQVSIPHTWYHFPRLEDVTPDTSIEPPPKPINWGN